MTVTSALGVVLTLVVTLLSLPGPARAGGPAPSPRVVPLDAPSASDLVYDHHNDRVYVATGQHAAHSPFGDEVLVFDRDGRLLRRIDGLPDPRAMDVSDDGSRLWVPVRVNDEVVAIDTGSLAIVDRVRLPDGFCPTSVIALRGKLVVGRGCSTQQPIATVALDGDRTPVTATLGADRQDAEFLVLGHTPALGDLVFAADRGGGSVEDIQAVDVSGAEPQAVASSSEDRNVGRYVRELAVSPDGATVVSAGPWGAAHESWRTDDLTLQREYPADGHPAAVAWSADGRLLATGSSDPYTSRDVQVHRAGDTTSAWAYDLQTGPLSSGAVALDAGGDRLYAISEPNHADDQDAPFLEIADVGVSPGLVRARVTLENRALGDPIPSFDLYDADTSEHLGRVANATFDDGSGRYHLRLLPGRYHLVTHGRYGSGYTVPPQAYAGEPGLRLDRADVVTVRAGSTLDIDIELGSWFTDATDHTFRSEIRWMQITDISRGCDVHRYCPDRPVTRGQMAAFLVRAFALPTASTTGRFVDTAGSTFEADIDRLAAAGITRGCNPPENDRYCPDALVSRGEMAAFLTRAFGLSSTAGSPDFRDDDDSPFEQDIERLAAAGITRGCNPPDNDRYCPDARVTRGQMAAFLNRGFEVVFGPGAYPWGTGPVTEDY